MQCVYKIENKLNGKIYVGSTTNYHRRTWLHKNQLKHNLHSNKKLQADYNKTQDFESFDFEVIESANVNTLNRIERQWMIILQSNDPDKGYNTGLPSLMPRTEKIDWLDVLAKGPEVHRVRRLLAELPTRSQNQPVIVSHSRQEQIYGLSDFHPKIILSSAYDILLSSVNKQKSAEALGFAGRKHT